MEGAARRVGYLADFGCPAGGLAAGRPRVLRHEAEIFVSTGREFVYAYDQGGRRLRVVYKFPDQVWHLEFLVLRRALYVLCAGKGVYCLSVDPPGRSVDQAEQEDEDSELPSCIVAVDPGTFVLPDATLCAFTVLDDMLVTLAQGPAQWKMQLFAQRFPGGQPGLGAQLGEAEFCASPAGSPGQQPAPRFLPVLCCLALHDHLRGPGGFTLQQALFGVLFGADATLLESPVILCGFPDGQLCCAVLKTLAASGTAWGSPKLFVKILHHLEEPVIFLGALRTELRAEEGPLDEDAPSDCLVVLGHHGRTLAIRATWDKAGNPVPDLQESRLPGPVLCAACGGGSRVYHSTPSDLCVVDLAQGKAPSGPAQPDGGPGGLPPPPCQASLDICSVVALSVSPKAPKGGTELLALLAKGRLVTCSLEQSSEVPRPAPMTAAKAGQKIKELLSGIGNISERVSSLKKALDQRNRALTCLNEAMNVSCALLSRQGGPRPIVCTTSTAWSHLLPRDLLVATCLLENRGAHSLGRGWALCLHVRPSTCTPELGPASPILTYTIPLDQLGPGSRREVTVTLGPGEDGVLNLPITISYALFYSLREVMGVALTPSGALEHPFLEECPLDTLPEQDGICLPLGEHMVDLLQCLRFPGLASPSTQAPSMQGPANDPVDTFLATLRGPGSEPAGPSSLRAQYLSPSVASIRVSAVLLQDALGAGCTGASLCCATLQWLLAENATVDAVRAQALSSVQAVAPDGGDIHLTVREVAVTDLSPAGPIQAVEIQVESASPANLCQAHHALVSRMQTVVAAQAARGSSPPELRLQQLRQMLARHEALLSEVQALRDRLCAEDAAQACAAAEKLLQVYGQLRHPGLLLL